MAGNKEIRKQKYQNLLQNGFSSKEAAKLRDASQTKIDKLIQAKKEALIDAETERVKQVKASSNEARKIKYNIAREYGFNSNDSRILSKLPFDQFNIALKNNYVPERKTHGIQYDHISTADKGYISKYTYKVVYYRKKRNKQGRWELGEKEYLTVTNSSKLTKAEVLKIAREIVTSSGVARYTPVDTIAVTKMQIEKAYINPELDERVD